MTQTLTRKVRQRVKALLSARDVQDLVLEERLVELFIELKNEPFINANSAPWAHPVIQMVKRITGKKVDPLVFERVKQKVGTHTEAEVREVITEWRFRGYNPENYGWLDWLEKGIPQRNIIPQPNSARRLPAGQSPASQLSVAEVNARLANGEL